MSDKSFWSDLSLDTCLLRSWSFITFEVGRGGWGGHFEKALVRRFQNNPPIQPSFLEMIPQKFYVIVIVTPHPIAMESTNIIATNRAEVYHILYLRSCLWDRCLLFTAVTFNFNSCSSLFWATFRKFMKIIPQVTLPYLKMSPQDHSRFWNDSPAKWHALSHR